MDISTLLNDVYSPERDPRLERSKKAHKGSQHTEHIFEHGYKGAKWYETADSR